MRVAHNLLTARSLMALAVLAFGCFTTAKPALSQQIVARVNGEPITAVDVAQRTSLIQASTRKAPGRQEVMDELIDEQLKLQTARRYRLDISETEVDNVLAGMAQRMRVDQKQFAGALRQAGIGMGAMKRKIRADIAWQQIVRGRFNPSLQVRDRDVAAILEKRQKELITAYDYTLRPILLIVPRGSGDNVIQARRREAEGLRTRFQNCDDGVRLARGLRDVAVRDAIIRSSGDFPQKLREVLDATPVGKLTEPDITPQGVEVFAVCEKKESTTSRVGERDARDELMGEKVSAQGKKYLQELRRNARITMQ